MKKIAAVTLSVIMASGLMCGCAGAGSAALSTADKASGEKVTRVYFDCLEKELNEGENFTLTAKRSGDTVEYKALDESVASVKAAGDGIEVTALKGGVTYIIAVDKFGYEYNACRLTVKEKGEKPNPPVDPNPPTPAKEDNSGMAYNAYNLATYTYPFWRGNTVYNETAMFIGNTDATPLLYKASKILKVTSYDLTVTYQEGLDWTYDKTNNLLRRTANSKMPFMAADDWVMTTEKAQSKNMAFFPTKNATHLGNNVWSEYLYFAEGKDISSKQIAITYEHEESAKDSWTLPSVSTSAFTKLKGKLERGEKVQVLFYGDSVVQGANASSFVGLAPNAEQYTDMIISYMKAHYPNANVIKQNLASGGTTAENALNYFPNRTPTSAIQTEPCTITPDLLVMGYGLNDQNAVGYTDEKFLNNLETLVAKARQNFPEIEILLVSPILGNPNSFNYQFGTQKTQENAMKNRFFPNGNAKYSGLAIAEVSTMHNQLYSKKGNRYQDITANNINHPNDMSSRLIAQTCLTTMFGADYFK